MASIYFKIDNIRGEVTTKPYDGWFKCETFWYGTDSVASGMYGHGTGKLNHDTVFATLYPGKANSEFYQATADGRSYHEATLVAKQGKAEVLRIIMKEVMIDSVRPGTLSRSEEVVLEIGIKYK